jgi:hypothetical protein
VIVSAHPGIQLRDDLARNGLAFLHRAAEELEERPHEALVHLAIGIELVLKARLAHEHWTLVDEKPGDNSLGDILQGTPRTVGFDKLATRIRNACGHGWSKADIATIKAIGEHRNKVVHFYHPALNGPDDELRSQVAQAQFRGWAMVRSLIVRHWSDAFPKSQSEVAKLHAKFLQNRGYLEVLLEQVSHKLTAAQARGDTVKECFNCEMESAVEHCETALVVHVECLVCDVSMRFVRLRCPLCSGAVHKAVWSDSTCECGRQITADDQEAQLGLSEHPLGSCWACEEGRVHVGRTGALCVGCLTPFEPNARACRICDEPWLGSPEGRFVCPRCERQLWPDGA